MSEHKKEKDALTGVETTGHEWDGLKELNNPAPRWWLWIFYITVIWSIGYWVVYPAWPTLSGEGERGGTKGKWEWTQYKKLQEEQAEISARRAQYMERFHNSSFGEIMNDPELYAFAVAGGSAAFKDNCATCHGSGGAGGPGYPNLNDDDWLWGGTPEAIYQTLQFGIRSGHPEARDSAMPAFGDMLDATQIADTADYVLALSEGKAAAGHPGAIIFAENCAACHGDYGKGNRDLGAPNLADAIWLKSHGEKTAIVDQIRNPQHGIMPHWAGRLNDDTLRQLTVYVHSLGGGE